ncbi:hypothetical protein M501DRAFT_992546 [Patellaria atrata CBS 101060]|uniref:Uncharacterized protein n=1 Tax=Patellaria atrata CBS 101060 TaxID=1346257 RepID=A0A9P4VQQ0_9PEZI|nr:hypothetical protein M501DRAFT_992546 [Patellaria atrata CBS 101060]
MPLGLSTCRGAVQLSFKSNGPYHWITDELLVDAFHRFARVANYGRKRFGSHVPGPLEARKRMAKRKIMAMTASGGGVSFDIGGLFGMNKPQPPPWKWEAPAPLKVDLDPLPGLDSPNSPVQTVEHPLILTPPVPPWPPHVQQLLTAAADDPSRDKIISMLNRNGGRHSLSQNLLQQLFVSCPLQAVLGYLEEEELLTQQGYKYFNMIFHLMVHKSDISISPDEYELLLSYLNRYLRLNLVRVDDLFALLGGISRLGAELFDDWWKAHSGVMTYRSIARALMDGPNQRKMSEPEFIYSFFRSIPHTHEFEDTLSLQYEILKHVWQLDNVLLDGSKVSQDTFLAMYAEDVIFSREPWSTSILERLVKQSWRQKIPNWIVDATIRIARRYQVNPDCSLRYWLKLLAIRGPHRFSECESLDSDHTIEIWAPIHRILACYCKPVQVREHFAIFSGYVASKLLITCWFNAENHIPSIINPGVILPEEITDMLRPGLTSWKPLLPLLQASFRDGSPLKRYALDILHLAASWEERTASGNVIFHMVRYLRDRSHLIPREHLASIVNHLIPDRPWQAYRMFSRWEELALSDCPTLPLAIVRTGESKVGQILRILLRPDPGYPSHPDPITQYQYLKSSDSMHRFNVGKRRVMMLNKTEMWLHITPKPLTDPRRHRLLEELALAYATHEPNTPLAFRNIQRIYRYLCRFSNRLSPKLSAALMKAGVTRCFQEKRWLPTSRFMWILDIVRRIEGEAVANHLDQKVYALRRYIFYDKYGRRRFWDADYGTWTYDRAREFQRSKETMDIDAETPDQTNAGPVNGSTLWKPLSEIAGPQRIEGSRRRKSEQVATLDEGPARSSLPPENSPSQARITELETHNIALRAPRAPIVWSPLPPTQHAKRAPRSNLPEPSEESEASDLLTPLALEKANWNGIPRITLQQQPEPPSAEDNYEAHRMIRYEYEQTKTIAPFEWRKVSLEPPNASPPEQKAECKQDWDSISSWSPLSARDD